MTADEKHRHECEVRDCIRRFYPHGPAMSSHLTLVERRRGKEAAQRLRDDCLIAWNEKRTKK